jgi:hypothetical protein
MTYDARAGIVQKVGAGLAQSRQNKVNCLHAINPHVFFIYNFEYDVI